MDGSTRPLGVVYMFYDALGFVLGGPMLWACKASQYLRPPVEEEDDDDDDASERRGPPLWRSVRGFEGLDARRYLDRIGWRGPPPAAGDRGALDALVERHLDAVPFENLDVMAGIPVRLDVAAAYAKVVDGRRGGFCFELNLAFAALLLRLGFDARLGLARVWRPGPSAEAYGDDVTAPQAPCWGGDEPATHVLVHVRLASGENAIVDVGFGEPPAAAVPVWGGSHDCGAYEFRVEKRGDLRSLERRSRGDRGLSGVVSPPGTWEPRVLFDARLSRPAADFEPGLNFVQAEASNTIFTRRPFLVRVRESDGAALTLAGGDLVVAKGGSRAATPLPPAGRAAACAEHFGVPAAALPPGAFKDAAFEKN